MPPVSLEAERAALGACLVDREALNVVMDILQPEDFYDALHRAAFEIVFSMSQRDRPVDPLTFLEEVSRQGKTELLGGQAFVGSLIDSVPTTANVEYHAGIVRDKAIHRRLISAGNTIVKLGYSTDMDVDDALEEAERAVFEIAQKRNAVNFRHVGEVLGSTFLQIEERYNSVDQEVAGFNSGFFDLDRLTGGFQPGSLNIVAARPSMGKTAFAVNIAQFGGQKQKLPVLIFSLEMGAEQLVQRMLGAEAKINIHDLRIGSFPQSSWEDLAEAAQSTTEVMTLLLAAIASISLLVGGIGIMNIMLVSVTERTREIGIRLAIGARGSDVMIQFLVESTVMSLVGGAIGTAAGFAGASVLGHFTGWNTAVSVPTVVLALAFSASVGIFFGFYPARRASTLDPIEALRYE